MAAPVVLHPRDIATPWTELDGKRNRIVVPAATAARLEGLPRPEFRELGQWEISWLDGTTMQVLDLATRKKWNVRRGQCGFGSCCCDLQAWPADYRGPVPPPEPFDAWMFNMDPEDWDALAVECGRDLGELGWDELLAAVSEVRGAGEE